MCLYPTPGFILRQDQPDFTIFYYEASDARACLLRLNRANNSRALSPSTSEDFSLEKLRPSLISSRAEDFSRAPDGSSHFARILDVLIINHRGALPPEILASVAQSLAIRNRQEHFKQPCGLIIGSEIIAIDPSQGFCADVRHLAKRRILRSVG